MMISKELNDAINAQIGREFGASHQYINIATWFDDLGLEELAKLFYKQADEEHEHAMKFVGYLVDTNSTVKIPAVSAAKSSFSTAEETVKLSLDWEVEVTNQINQLYAMAVSQKDYASQNFLDWFVEEQVEEVNSMDNLLKIIQRAGEKNLMVIETYLAQKQ